MFLLMLNTCHNNGPAKIGVWVKTCPRICVDRAEITAFRLKMHVEYERKLQIDLEKPLLSKQISTMQVLQGKIILESVSRDEKSNS